MILDRSLEYRRFCVPEHERRQIILERLVDGGFFQNNRQMIVYWYWSPEPWLLKVIFSMNNLQKLDLLNWQLKPTKEDLACLFRSCPKLTELHLTLNDWQNEMNEDLKNELRSGFERLQLFELEWFINSWPGFHEIFT